MREKVSIEVAGICACLRMKPNHSRLVNRIQKDYSAFLSDKKPDLTIDINFTDKRYSNVSSWSRLTTSEDGFKLTDDYFQSQIDLEEGYSVASLSLEGWATGLSTLLRNIFTLMSLLERGGVVLEAAGILKDGRVYIFMAPSGGGKTTAARLSEKYTILSDNLVIIKPVKKDYYVFPHPYWLDMQKGYRENRPYVIGGFFKLIKDERIYLKKIPQAKAIAEIFTVPHIPHRIQPIPRLLNSFCNILDKYSFYELHFLKDKSFWGCINKAL